MSCLSEVENLEFKWGKKRGVGGKKKEVQFYESFTYDGVEYTLHDSVYMHKEGEPPYIGKLIKIWETPDKTKKVKVLWFFRPSEILNWLGDEEALENEIFLASGKGDGLTKVNPLEAIAGKCNVVCTSRDRRNPQPSVEDLQMADYIFYRTFDVGHCTISDKMDDKVAEVDVKFIFNRKESEKYSCVPKLDSVAEQNPSEEFKTAKTEGNSNHLVVKEDADVKDSLVKRKSLPGGKPASGVGADSGEVATVIGEQGSVSGEKTIRRCVVDSDKVLDKGEKSAKDSCALEDRPSKKAKFDSSTKLSEDKNRDSVQKLSINSDRSDVKDFVGTVTSSEEKSKSRLAKDSLGLENIPPQKQKPDEKVTKFSNGKLLKASARESPDDDSRTEGKEIEVTRRPDADKSKWFRALPWEERIQTAHEEGKLVLLQNLDPEYTSAEVEDIIWHGFSEICTAKMVQRTAISSPHSGQAFIIFKAREAAERVIRKLDEGCLMLSNGRPLVGGIAPPPCLPGKQSTFFGHLFIDKIKMQMQREMKQAVSTSHCSQPNTIEYEMAMEWCLLQSRSESWWKRLYKQQGEELRKLKANLKSK
uniref:BAH domain-containing protein n=1 Tax=Davidia involucrata TaxID=16924 RepID=A0A5B7B2F1_DAVIN